MHALNLPGLTPHERTAICWVIGHECGTLRNAVHKQGSSELAVASAGLAEVNASVREPDVFGLPERAAWLSGYNTARGVVDGRGHPLGAAERATAKARVLACLFAPQDRRAKGGNASTAAKARASAFPFGEGVLGGEQKDLVLDAYAKAYLLAWRRG